MKVLLLVNSVHPGGAENFAFYLIRYLKNYHYDITIAYIRDIDSKSGQYNLEELSQEFPIYWLGKKNNSGVRGLLGSFGKLKKLYKKNKYDIILSSCELPDLYSALLKCEAWKVSILQNAVAWAHKPKLGDFLESRVVKPRIDFNVAVSESTKNIWISRYGVDPNKVIVAPNGAHDIFYTVKEKRSIVPGQVFKLGVVARLEPQKGHIYLLQAMKELKGKMPVELHIVGKGSLEEELQQFVKDNDLGDVVHFHGWYNREEVCNFYRSVNVLVMSSLFEGLPLNGIEAMATGLPVIGSRVPGIVDFLNDDNGLLFESGNYIELAARITQLAKDPVLYDRLTNQSRQEAVKYQYSAISVQYDDLFKKLLNQPQ